jgi:membrane protease YdiL (CAAX protease family)
LIVTARTSGNAGVRLLLGRFVPVGRSAPFYLLGVLAFSAIAAAAWAMEARDARALMLFVSSSAFLHTLPMRIAIDTGPLGEEAGWRGFALPRMLRFSNPAAASVLLGIIWTLWHVPAFFMPDLPQHQIAFAPFALNTIALAVIFTWFYLRTGGDLLLMALLHLLANLVAGALGLPLWAVASATSSLALLAWLDPRMRVKPAMTSTETPVAR